MSGSTLYLFGKCLKAHGYSVSEIIDSEEGAEYAACTFKIHELDIIYRQSKITPTKTGQFVTTWKRNKAGVTEPFDVTDNFDCVLIACGNKVNMGAFIFSKDILSAQGIISGNGKPGKRGLRVYPPWDVAPNKQAVKTQQWQQQYFIDLKETDSTTAAGIIRLLPGI